MSLVGFGVQVSHEHGPVGPTIGSRPREAKSSSSGTVRDRARRERDRWVTKASTRPSGVSTRARRTTRGPKRSRRSSVSWVRRPRLPIEDRMTGQERDALGAARARCPARREDHVIDSEESSEFVRLTLPADRVGRVDLLEADQIGLHPREARASAPRRSRQKGAPPQMFCVRTVSIRDLMSWNIPGVRDSV